MKRAHFDVEEDGFYGTYWACKDTRGRPDVAFLVFIHGF